MPIFSLRKYDTNTEVKENVVKDNEEENVEPKEKTIFIQAEDTISDIVIKSLYENFLNAKVEKVENENVEPDVQVISSESINRDFVEAYRNIKCKNIFIFTDGKPFKSIAEEWFLTNTKEKNVFVTTSEFISFLKKL